jgi:hypothetical protein
MDPSIIIAIALASLNSFLPVIFASVKSAASKAKLKKFAPQLRTAAQELVAIADMIDSVSVKRKL